jgi:hypothetical protein
VRDTCKITCGGGSRCLTDITGDAHCDVTHGGEGVGPPVSPVTAGRIRYRGSGGQGRLAYRSRARDLAIAAGEGVAELGPLTGSWLLKVSLPVALLAVVTLGLRFLSDARCLGERPRYASIAVEDYEGSRQATRSPACPVEGAVAAMGRALV